MDLVGNCICIMTGEGVGRETEMSDAGWLSTYVLVDETAVHMTYIVTCSRVGHVVLWLSTCG